VPVVAGATYSILNGLFVAFSVQDVLVESALDVHLVHTRDVHDVQTED